MQDKLILHPEFSLIPEGNDVRIRNKHVNYLFGRMNEQDFMALLDSVWVFKTSLSTLIAL